MANRIFVYDGREFPDPDPKLSVDEVRQHMTTYFPELANAEVKQSKRGEDDIYEFKRRVGTKGWGMNDPVYWKLFTWVMVCITIATVIAIFILQGAK